MEQELAKIRLHRPGRHAAGEGPGHSVEINEQETHHKEEERQQVRAEVAGDEQAQL